MELLSDVLKLLRDKYNYTFYDEIGSGMSGTVYDIGKNVLKITKDKEEAFAASKIKHKIFHNVYNVFRVFTLKKQQFAKYYIECEKLIPLRITEDFEELYEYIIQNQDSDFKKYLNSINDIINSSNNPEELEQLFKEKNSVEKDFFGWYVENNSYNFEIELFKLENKFKRLRKQFNDLINGINELKSLDIIFNDIHLKNIMKDTNGNYKFVDVTSYKKQDIEILENKGFNPQSKKIKYAVTDKQKANGLKGIELNDWSGLMVFENVKPGDMFVGKDCLFDIRIAFLDLNNVVLSVQTLEKETGVAIAPPKTVKAIETASEDDYKIIPGNKFLIPANKFHFPTKFSKVY